MPYTSTQTRISYADYGPSDGKPVVLIHGWPLSHRMWEYQIGALAEAGHRVVAYDRRGFGESDKPWDGYDYDTLTQDLTGLIDELDLRDAALVGFSMGGGEVARYLAPYGSDRVRSAVLMSSVTPAMGKGPDNPNGVPAETLAGFGEAMENDRIGFLDKFNRTFFGVTSDRNDVISAPLLHHFRDIASWANPKATLACAESFGSTDFTDDVKKIDVPTLIIHGDADRTVPYEATALRAAEMIDGSRLETLKGAPHGLFYTHRTQVNELLLDFLSA